MDVRFRGQSERAIALQKTPLGESLPFEVMITHTEAAAARC